MTPRAWLATWAEIGSLVADHIGEGLQLVARVIDPPEVVKWVRADPDEQDEPESVYVVQLTPGAVRVAWCNDCMVSHAFLSLYATPDGPPAAEWADHNEEDE